RALTRAWQILFKGNEETARAGNGLQAAEMTLIRLAYAADLPSPDEVISKLTSQAMANAPMPGPAPRALPQGGGGSGGGGGSASAQRIDPAPMMSTDPVAVSRPQAVAQPALATVASYKDLI